MALQPKHPVPPLTAGLAGGGTFTLGESRPENFTLVVFFRGLHCPVCNAYLNTLQDMLPDFAERGVDVVAVSMETPERGEACKTDWGLDQLAVGHSVDEATARAWGLFITEKREGDEPDKFNEPGLFIVDRDGKESNTVINSGPRLRPDLKEVLAQIDRRLGRA